MPSTLPVPQALRDWCRIPAKAFEVIGKVLSKDGRQTHKMLELDFEGLCQQELSLCGFHAQEIWKMLAEKYTNPLLLQDILTKKKFVENGIQMYMSPLVRYFYGDTIGEIEALKAACIVPGVNSQFPLYGTVAKVVEKKKGTIDVESFLAEKGIVPQPIEKAFSIKVPRLSIASTVSSPRSASTVEVQRAQGSLKRWRAGSVDNDEKDMKTLRSTIIAEKNNKSDGAPAFGS